MYNYTPTELQEILDKSTSYKDVLSHLNMCVHGNNYITLKKVIDEYNLDITKLSENRENERLINIKKLHQSNKISLDEILVKNSTYNHSSDLKNKLLDAKLKEYKCECCGLTEWNNKPIPLQLHHKDGDHYNNELGNLELLCPNCHAQTDTYAGKNIDHTKQKKKEKIFVLQKAAFQMMENDYMIDMAIIRFCALNVKLFL